MDAYTPIPIEELNEALGLRRTRLPRLVLLGGILGGLGGFGLEYWASTIAYPMNVGGRPLNSWPQFIPVTFETTVLGAALTCFMGMWALNKLPQPYHPVFNVPAFDRASTRPVLPVHRGHRSALRRARDPRVSRDACTGRSIRRCAVRPPCRLVRALVVRVLARACARVAALRGGLPPGHARRPAATIRCRPPRSSPTAGPRGRSSPTPSRAASCARTTHLYQGRVDGQLATTFPMPVTAQVMARGQERFNVFCAPCHGKTGGGNGMVVQRGFRAPPSYPGGAPAQRAGGLLLRRHDQRLRRHAGLLGAGAGRRTAGRLPPTSARCS